MEIHELEIEIRPGGEVALHVKGAKGPVCLEYAKFFEQILSAREQRVELTSEYYEPPTGERIHLQEKV